LWSRGLNPSDARTAGASLRVWVVSMSGILGCRFLNVNRIFPVLMARAFS
jgi:hypothetical protein